MSYLDDPRVYFAAERTLLAWIRTGITIIGLGFVVARFGLFLRYLTMHDGQLPQHSSSMSLWVGVALVLLGAISCIGGAIQFRRFIGQLTGAELPPRWFPAFPALIAFTLAAGGAVLAVYLVINS